MGEKKRSFYGWGFEGDVVSPEELGWFERAWSELFRIDHFDPATMPREGGDHVASVPNAIARSFEAVLHK
jgi:acyl-CoA thioesterase FadM